MLSAPQHAVSHESIFWGYNGWEGFLVSLEIFILLERSAGEVIVFS
jgi:hypothetical protein